MQLVPLVCNELRNLICFHFGLCIARDAELTFMLRQARRLHGPPSLSRGAKIAVISHPPSGLELGDSQLALGQTSHRSVRYQRLPPRSFFPLERQLVSFYLQHFCPRFGGRCPLIMSGLEREMARLQAQASDAINARRKQTNARPKQMHWHWVVSRRLRIWIKRHAFLETTYPTYHQIQSISRGPRMGLV